MTLGNRDTERSSNLLKEMWLKRTGKSTQVFPGCGACIESRFVMARGPSWSRPKQPSCQALAGLRFQEPDVKFGKSPFQSFGPGFAEMSSFAQGIVWSHQQDTSYLLLYPSLPLTYQHCHQDRKFMLLQSARLVFDMQPKSVPLAS